MSNGPRFSNYSRWVWMFFFIISPLFSSDRSKVKEANQLFREGKMDQALVKYRDALLDNPTSPEIHFNIGNTLYKMGKYEEANKEFESSLTSKEINLQAKSYYNMGNSFFKQNKLPEAIQMYKKSLDLDSGDEDAKFNLELARAKLKEMAEKKPMRNSQQQNQGGQDQSREDQSEENSQQTRQEMKTTEAKADETKKNRGEKSLTGSEEKEKMTKEQAELILNALKNSQKNFQKDKQKIRSSGSLHNEKDW